MAKQNPRDWTCIYVPKTMLAEIHTIRRPYEPNYAVVARLLKKVKR